MPTDDTFKDVDEVVVLIRWVTDCDDDFATNDVGTECGRLFEVIAEGCPKEGELAVLRRAPPGTRGFYINYPNSHVTNAIQVPGVWEAVEPT